MIRAILCYPYFKLILTGKLLKRLKRTIFFEIPNDKTRNLKSTNAKYQKYSLVEFHMYFFLS